MMIERLQKELKYGKVFLGFAFLRIIGHGLMFLVPLLLARFFSVAAIFAVLGAILKNWFYPRVSKLSLKYQKSNFSIF